MFFNKRKSCKIIPFVEDNTTQTQKNTSQIKENNIFTIKVVKPKYKTHNSLKKLVQTNNFSYFNFSSK